MEEITSKKREREDSDELIVEKRLRSDLLLNIFDDETDAGSEDGLASVMKSLEEEIGLHSPLEHPQPLDLALDSREEKQPDLGYLLEASDDELGLPPTVGSSEEDGREIKKVFADMDPGFGQIWGLADEFSECYDGFDYAAFRPEETESLAGVLDGELFGYADEVCPPSDLAEMLWRPESLPAV